MLIRLACAKAKKIGYLSSRTLRSVRLCHFESPLFAEGDLCKLKYKLSPSGNYPFRVHEKSDLLGSSHHALHRAPLSQMSGNLIVMYCQRAPSTV